MKRILSLILMICGLASAAYAQDRLVTHRFIRDKVTEGYFQQKTGTTIPLDDYCINATEAKTWLHLVENMLPAEPGRMPWWSELVPIPKVLPCNEYYDPACQADYESYGACGSWLYQAGFDVYFSSFNRQRLGGTTNPLWNPSAALGAEYCATPPVTQQSAMALRSVVKSNLDSALKMQPFPVPASSPDSAGIPASSASTFAATASVWSGALNRCGVWQCNNTVGTSVWMSISGSFTAPVAKTYYIGVGADNLFELYIDGLLIAAMNNPDNVQEDAFLLWHILPVTLTAGSHTIELRARNTQTGPASLGCEVYNNTPSELGNAASEDDLKLLFTSQSYRGGSICRTPVKIILSNYTSDGNMSAEYGGISYQMPAHEIVELEYAPGNYFTLHTATAFFELYVNVYVDGAWYSSYLVNGTSSTHIPIPTNVNSGITIEVSN